MQYAKLTEDNKLIIPDEFNGGYYPSTSELIHPEEWMELVTTDKPQETAIVKYSEAYYVDTMSNPPRIIQRWNQYILEPVGRVAKLSGSQLVFPPQNLTLEDGTLICNADKLPNSRLLQYGFYLVKNTPCPNDGQKYMETGVLVDDADFGKVISIVWEVSPTIPEPSFDISKLKLGRAFRDIGQESAFEAYLSSDPIIAKDWERAVNLRSDDPLVITACGMFKEVIGLTDIQIKKILNSCRYD